MVPRHGVEVELLESGKRLEECEHVAGRPEAHFEEKQRLHAAKDWCEGGASRSPERAPVETAEREGVHAAVGTESTRNGGGAVHPGLVFWCADYVSDSAALGVDGKLADAASDYRRGLEQAFELGAGLVSGRTSTRECWCLSSGGSSSQRACGREVACGRVGCR